MQLVSSLLAARARRNEGRPVDLTSQRRLNDRISGWMPVPRGITVGEEVLGGVPVVRLSSAGTSRGTVLHFHGGAYALGSARQALSSITVCADGGPDLISVEYRLGP